MNVRFNSWIKSDNSYCIKTKKWDANGNLNVHMSQMLGIVPASKSSKTLDILLIHAYVQKNILDNTSNRKLRSRRFFVKTELFY